MPISFNNRHLQNISVINHCDSFSCLTPSVSFYIFHSLQLLSCWSIITSDKLNKLLCFLNSAPLSVCQHFCLSVLCFSFSVSFPLPHLSLCFSSSLLYYHIHCFSLSPVTQACACGLLCNTALVLSVCLKSRLCYRSLSRPNDSVCLTILSLLVAKYPLPRSTLNKNNLANQALFHHECSQLVRNALCLIHGHATSHHNAMHVM